MTSMSISNKKILSCNWSATNNNLMSSGNKDVSFRCIIWTKEIFFWQSGILFFFLTKGELVYQHPFKRPISKSQFQNPRNLDEKDWFFHTIHTRIISNSRRNKKYIKCAFTPTARGIIRGTNEILLKNYNDKRLYQLNDILSHNPDGKTQSLCCLMPSI